MSDQSGPVQFCAVPNAEMTIYANVFEKRSFSVECNDPNHHALLRVWENLQSGTHNANSVKSVKLNAGDKTTVTGYRVTVTAFEGPNSKVLVAPL